MGPSGFIDVGGGRPAAGTFFNLARRYLEAAELQNNRIWLNPPQADADDVKGSFDEVQSRFEAIRIEMHLYFVVLDDLYRYLGRLIQEEPFAELRPKLDALNDKYFRHYNKARRLFEHMVEKLDLLMENDKPINHGLNLTSGVFRHTDVETDIYEVWDFSQATFTRLKHDVEDLMSLVVGLNK